MDRTLVTAEAHSFRLEVEPGETIVAGVIGDVDPPDGPRLLELLSALLGASRTGLTIDLSRVGIFGSGGIQALEGVAEQAAAEGKSILICQPADHFRSILTALEIELPLEPLGARPLDQPDGTRCVCGAGAA